MPHRSLNGKFLYSLSHRCGLTKIISKQYSLWLCFSQNNKDNRNAHKDIQYSLTATQTAAVKLTKKCVCLMKLVFA